MRRAAEAKVADDAGHGGEVKGRAAPQKTKPPRTGVASKRPKPPRTTTAQQKADDDARYGGEVKAARQAPNHGGHARLKH
jgi:hypothetical protein